MMLFSEMLEKLKEADEETFKEIAKDLKKNQEEENLELKDSTRAAKLAKLKIAHFVCEQARGLSEEEIADIFGSVSTLLRGIEMAYSLDVDFGTLYFRKLEKISKEHLAKFEDE